MPQVLFQFVVKVFVRTDLIEVDDHKFNRCVSGRRSVSYLAEIGIQSIAEAAGVDSEQALADAHVFQFLFRLRPT